uniref:Kinesin family member 15 n=1 Tax=Mastacembelus armatus TaxID=205130 RepID=A0A7N8X945_9TELE
MNSIGKGSGDSAHLAASGDSDSIRVFVRVRPLTQGTGLTTDGDQSLCLTVTSPNTVRLLSKPEPRTFTYDHVADMDTSQESVFNSVAKNIVESCMNGYNGTIFAYGQTGSGKTFTMLGPSELDNFTDDLRGVIPRSFEYLFFLINREIERSSQSKSFLCKCSFIEIYNEQIYDLLDTASASLFLRENIKKGVFVEGAVEKFVSSAAEAYQVLSMGWRNRRVASTSMNRESSRSHAVFTMTLESKESVNEVVNIRTSQLNLVDLAGSERQKDTHTEGSRLKEASSINRSLMCLGQVIMALVDVSNGKNRHICYRDSKLTFLLRDSLGGNAKTYTIANVHPGSKCFGETLSTLQFAQRAKLIKNKAIINEDTQGNVRQLQAEVKKLRDQLAQHDVTYKTKFLAAVGLWKKREEEKRVLLEKVAQLEKAWTQKDKFIHSSRMIIRFREDHIARLEKKLKAGHGLLSDEESQALIDQLKEEIKILSDQVEHHPKMIRYAAENFSLREENRLLRSLGSVVKAEEAVAQLSAELEETFQGAMELESPSATPSTPVAADTVSASTVEKLKAQLLQKQSDLTAALQAFEEYKEVTKKQMSQLESDKRYLDKSNRHLEKILEATNAYKKHEVSELNRIHVETIKILSTPTKACNLRSRLVPFSSPDHLNGTESNDIWNEQPPLDMTIMALTEELRQEQASTVQTQLNEEELKNSKLLQEIAKLEEQITVLSQQCDHKDEVDHSLCKVQMTEIRDLRLVLQSSDKELAAVKNKLRDGQSEQQREMEQLSNSLISTQLQLDKVRELTETVEQNTELRKQISVLTIQNQQQVSRLVDLEQSLTSANETIKCLEQKTEQDKDVVLDLINQTRDLRNELSQKDQTISLLSGEIKDITVISFILKFQPLRVFSAYVIFLYSTKGNMFQVWLCHGMYIIIILMSSCTDLLFLIRLFSKTPCTPGSFGMDLTQVLESQERELENRRSSMMTMESLLAELNGERAAKNEEIQRLRVLSNSLYFFLLWIRLQAQESMLGQSQTCVQELTTELRNRCLELRDLSMRRQQDDEKLLQVRVRDLTNLIFLQENEVLRKQNIKLSEENGKLVGHKNHKQRIEYLVKLKKDNTKLQEENETLRTELSLLRDNNGCPPLVIT